MSFEETEANCILFYLYASVPKCGGKLPFILFIILYIYLFQFHFVNVTVYCVNTGVCVLIIQMWGGALGADGSVMNWVLVKAQNMIGEGEYS